MVRVIEALSEEQLEIARHILRGFPDHQRVYYRPFLHIVEKYFDDVAYANELRDLGLIYGPPSGAVLLGSMDEVPVGVIALRALDATSCEMKRLFVLPEQRRKGLARALCDALVAKARKLGYTTMRLDTGTFMLESQALYRSMGFRYIRPYYEVREELRDGLVYMELDL